jgi:predicted ATPase/GAF domain-containing protein/anti-anti-sigma regulatory factor
MIQLAHCTLNESIYEDAATGLYRGHRDVDRLPVTVKVTRNSTRGLQELAKLRHEYGVLRELDVDGVPKVHALERCGNELAMVMEHLEGRILSELLVGPPMDPSAALRIGISLAKILQHLHEHRIIHKDINPFNIIYSGETRQVHLLNFGIAARLAQEIQRVTAPDTLEGRLAYISPEQTGRMNRVIDRRSDFYSLGVTLYVMLTGALPFDATEPMELVHSHIARRPTPPHQRAPGVLPSTSDLVMKLLAKTAEERYQSAHGLHADLITCLEQQTTGQGAPFTLGKHDRPDELRIPQHLYGREAETAELLSAFGRVSQGGAELLLVAGYSGVGKSVLVNELHKSIARSGGYFIAGKFDQLNRNVPYASIAQAFREMMRLILTERAESLARWRERLSAAVGSNGGLLLEIIPELQLIIGPQPSVPDLGPTESQNRFSLLFQHFVLAFCAKEHPLVIFLDDLQWADAASLKLLHILLTTPEQNHLLLIGAYRDNEVDTAHQLTLALDSLRKTSAKIHQITLRPLSEPDVTHLVADTLKSTRDEVAPLAGLVFNKTHGNPFFINQLLGMLHAERWLYFDNAQATWRWDLDKIEQHQVTDNVVYFMAGKLRRMAVDTQRALTLAACIGHQFDLRTLALVYERSPAETAAALWVALQEGLVLPVDSSYRFIYNSDDDVGLGVSFRFLHDRVQQAAYSLIEEEEHKPQIHLRIGRLMLAASPSAAEDAALFSIVTHLNYGSALIEGAEERLLLARLNLTAGAKAKSATAYVAAAGYFGAGVSMLSEASWETERALCLALHMEQAECESLTGRLEQVEALFDRLLRHVASDMESAKVDSLRITFYNTLGRFALALEIGRACLARLGVHLPDSPEQQQQQLMEELGQAAINLGSRRIEELIEAPLISNPEQEMVLKLLTDLTTSVYMTVPSLFPVVLLKQVNISLKYGHSAMSAYGYVSYGLLLAGAFGKYTEGYEFGRLALALNERLRNADLTCKIHLVFGVYLHFREPLRLSLDHYEQARQAGLESGDFVYVSYACQHTASARLCMGDDLGVTLEEINTFLTLMNQTNDLLSTLHLKLCKQLGRSLQGRTESLNSLNDQQFNEAEFLALLTKNGFEFVSYWYYLIKLQTNYLCGDYASALTAAREAELRLASATGFYFSTELPFFLCLTLLALGQSADAELAQRHRDLFAQNKAKLAAWSDSCSANYRHKLLLIAAEEARASGEGAEAERLYDEAIHAAQQSGFTSHEALANELAARFYYRQNRREFARAYLADARHGYQRWGAAAKVMLLDEAYASIVKADTPPHGVAPIALSRPPRPVTSGLLDIATVLRAAQAIASEVHLDKVLGQLMRNVLTNAGAQRGFLILDRDGRLFVEASIQVDPDTIQVNIGEPIESVTNLAVSLVQYVARTREPVVLDEAGTDARFSSDPYLAAHKPKSLLCLCLLYQSRLTGVLYLENRDTSFAFTSDRIELLQMLSAQAAIAVENALLYERLQAATRQLEQYNEGLGKANDQLKAEFAERVSAEQARSALQEEIIQMQRTRLAEMSTPLIPITDRIMVMPLIGTVDAQRAQQILDTALHGAQRHRASVVIIDITGIKYVDTNVASTLINAAAALRLIGAEAFITGMRPEVAMTLVGLGIDLGSLVTRSTLQSGIAYALSDAGASRWITEKRGPRGVRPR